MQQYTFKFLFAESCFWPEKCLALLGQRQKSTLVVGEPAMSVARGTT
jgi:hypothetical protein